MRQAEESLAGFTLSSPATAGALSLLRARTFVARAAFIASEPASTSSSLGALSSVASQLGIPGLSVPCGKSKEGLPIGCQVLTKHFDEATMFRVGHAIEHACAVTN